MEDTLTGAAGLLRGAWAITREALDDLIPILRGVLQAGESAAPDLAAAEPGALAYYSAAEPLRGPLAPALVSAAQADGDAGAGLIAVVPVEGVILPRVSAFAAFFGAISPALIAARVHAAVSDPAVKAVVLNFHSPGGSVLGVPEGAASMRRARGSKPIVAVANFVAASAAYWLAAQADEIVGAPSSEVGSVGVFVVHQDISEMAAKAGVKHTIVSAGDLKNATTPLAPLSEEGKADLQAKVNYYLALFEADLAAGRGIDVAAVRADFGKGLTLTAPAAKRAGMLDRVATLEATLERLSTHQGRRAAMRAPAAESEPAALGELSAEASVVSGDADIRLRRAKSTI